MARIIRAVNPLLSRRRWRTWHSPSRPISDGLAPSFERTPRPDELDGSDIDTYLSTMRRLRCLAVTAVHGGRESSFVRDRLIEICALYLAARG
jgi:hypothetical protein